MVHKDHVGACSEDTGVMRLLRAVTWPQKWPQGEIAVRKDCCTVSRSAQLGQVRAQDQHVRQRVAPHYIRVQSQTCMHINIQEAWKWHKETRESRSESKGRGTMGGGKCWGRGTKKRRAGREKKALILPSQQTASGVPACQFHWVGEVEHCSVSDLHSVYYAVTGAPRPRGGLLNSNMHQAALFSLTTSWALSFSAA